MLKYLLSNIYCLIFSILLVFNPDRMLTGNEMDQSTNEGETMFKSIPIVKSSLTPSGYEQVLMTIIRDKTSSKEAFRNAARKVGALLVNKVVDCFDLVPLQIETPLTSFQGKSLPDTIELVSIMRSGDALVDVFIDCLPNANVSKILVQRDEETTKPHFKYMKLSKTIASSAPVVITEPMLATGGTLDMVIALLKEQGVKEKDIIIASICASPEGLLFLNERYPEIKVVLTVVDEKLNDRMYIVPGLGDFGDRYFGT